jgi:hypothetical protein
MLCLLLTKVGKVGYTLSYKLQLYPQNHHYPLLKKSRKPYVTQHIPQRLTLCSSNGRLVKVQKLSGLLSVKKSVIVTLTPQNKSLDILI